MFFDLLDDELFSLLKWPKSDGYDLDGRIRVSLTILRISSAPVTDNGHDLNVLDRHLLDLLNQPCVDVELVFPINLLVHDRPSAGGLVIIDGDRPVFIDNL